MKDKSTTETDLKITNAVHYRRIDKYVRIPLKTCGKDTNCSGPIRK